MKNIFLLFIFFFHLLNGTTCKESQQNYADLHVLPESTIKRILFNDDLRGELEKHSRTQGYANLKDWKVSIAGKISNEAIDFHFAKSRLNKANGYVLSQEEISESRLALKNQMAWSVLFREAGIATHPSYQEISNAVGFEGEQIKSDAQVDSKDTYFHREKSHFPRWGSPGAKITVIEFSDFTCAYCRKFHTVSQAIREKYKDRIEWVFVDYPIEAPPFENSPAHFLSVCIHSNPAPIEQFWKFYDSAYTRKRMYDANEVANLALESGLSRDEWQSCWNKGKAKDSAIQRLSTNQREGGNLGLRGTPSFLVGSKKVVGFLPQEKFEKIIESELIRVDK